MVNCEQAGNCPSRAKVGQNGQPCSRMAMTSVQLSMDRPGELHLLVLDIGNNDQGLSV